MKQSKKDQKTKQDSGILQIKKYGNRRFYLSSESRFITITDLARYVRSGTQVQVTDSDTEEDITSAILTQILLEEGRAQHFPAEMLEKMIRVNENALKNFWGSYLEQSAKVFENIQENIQESMNENWQALRKSNLFFKWMESVSAGEQQDGPVKAVKSSQPKGKSRKGRK